MLKIAFLLMGTQFIKEKSLWIFILGSMWALLGLFILFDSLDGIYYFPMSTFALFLVIESLITLFVAWYSSHTQKIILYFKGLCFLFIAVLILIGKHYSNLLLAILFSFTFLMFGLLSIITTFLVQFKHWRKILLKAILDICIGVFLLIPYTPDHRGIFENFLAIMMITSGISAFYLSLKIKNLNEGDSIFEFLSGDSLHLKKIKEQPVSECKECDALYQQPTPLIVHIWTPDGSSRAETINFPVFNRYIAAIDREGRVSTGHSALEIPDKLYISLYPAKDIDYTPSEFFNLLKAGEENNVEGEYKKSYLDESNNWRSSNIQIKFYRYNLSAVQNFWQRYQQDEIYNLTYRNCSSSVAYALEAALEGVLYQTKQKSHLFQVLLMPELWVAAQIKERAMSMAWTPGLTMDYARALQAIIHPSPKKWYIRFYLMLKKQLIKANE